VIVSGGIDLSVGSVYALAGVLCAMALRNMGTSDPFLTVVVGAGLAVAIGVACGFVNGLMVVGLNVHPFIITLGTMWILRGLAFVTSHAESILLPPAMTGLPRRPLGLAASLYPVPMLVMLGVTVCGAVYLSRTVMGRHILAVGGNQEASRFAGLRINRIKIGVFVVSGLTAGLAAFMGASFYGSASCADRHRVRALRHRLGRRRRRQPVGWEGQCGERDAGRGADRADPAVHPHAALRSELRVDHHRLRGYRGRGAGPGQRAVRRKTLAQMAVGSDRGQTRV
jgi:hypothetical protein